MEIRYIIDDQAALAALARAPEVMTRNLEASLDRAASEVEDEMRGEASEHDVFGTLKESIRVRQFAPLERFIGPTANYAVFAEDGTGPAAGKARYYPNPDNLLQFLRQSPAARGFGWAKKASPKRGGQDVDLWFRSRALAWSIYQHGTQAHPIVAPTAEKMKGRFFALMDEGAQNGISEAMA